MSDRERLAENWRLFRKHVPVGAYLPVGVLDGDCRECGGEWPCQPIADALAQVLAEARAEALREAAAAAGWMQYPASQDPRDWAKWLRTRADDAALAAAEPEAGEGLTEQGRRLASRRDDLIAQGVDPAALEVPLAPGLDAGGCDA